MRTRLLVKGSIWFYMFNPELVIDFDHAPVNYREPTYHPYFLGESVKWQPVTGDIWHKVIGVVLDRRNGRDTISELHLEGGNVIEIRVVQQEAIILGELNKPPRKLGWKVPEDVKRKIVYGV